MRHRSAARRSTERRAATPFRAAAATTCSSGMAGTTPMSTMRAAATTACEGLSSGNGDRLSLGAGLTADILTFNRVGTSVTLHFAAQSGSIYLDRQFEGFDNGVEQIAFANGTIWTKADLQSAYLASVQTVGSDVVEGFGTNGTLQGGVGDDQLFGDYGNDTYAYNAGDGNDRIFEGLSSGNGDRLSLGAGLTADVLTFDRVGTGVTLRFAGQS